MKHDSFGDGSDRVNLRPAQRPQGLTHATKQKEEWRRFALIHVYSAASEGFLYRLGYDLKNVRGEKKVDGLTANGEKEPQDNTHSGQFYCHGITRAK